MKRFLDEGPHEGLTVGLCCNEGYGMSSVSNSGEMDLSILQVSFKELGDRYYPMYVFPRVKGIFV